MELVKGGKITLREAGEKIGVSYRQAKRIRQAIRDRGIKALVHGNRGQPSNHRIKEALREKVLGLSREFTGTLTIPILPRNCGNAKGSI